MAGRRALAVVAAATVLLAGCGGDSGTTSSSTASPDSLTRKEFVEKARAICLAATEKIGRESEAFLKRRARETGEEFGLVGQVDMVRQIVAPSLEAELEALEALDAPPGEAYEVEAMWQTLRIVLHEVEVEGMYAWRSAKLLVPWRNRARPFGLDGCILN
jgi:hypothetical protein